MLGLGLCLALAPLTVASAAKHSKKHAAKHHKSAKKSTHETTTTKPSSSTSSSGTYSVKALHCPDKSVITAATSVTFTGPATTNGGTAACIYNDAAGDELNVIEDSPDESLSQFVASDPSDIGEPAQQVSGYGKAAFTTTTYGHAEIDVYESSTKGFSVTFDPANEATVTTADLTECEEVAHAVLAG